MHYYLVCKQFFFTCDLKKCLVFRVLRLQKYKERVLLVEERKSLIDSLLNKTELARLVVDSGEIKAKLELSNLHDSTNGDDGINDAGKRVAKGTTPIKANIPDKTTIPPKGTIGNTDTNLPEGMSDLIGKIPIKEFIDPNTNFKTLIVDKKSIPERLGVKASIPDVRVVARPVKMTTNSNLYSEVVIKFKTV